MVHFPVRFRFEDGSELEFPVEFLPEELPRRFDFPIDQSRGKIVSIQRSDVGEDLPVNGMVVSEANPLEMIEVSLDLVRLYEDEEHSRTDRSGN